METGVDGGGRREGEVPHEVRESSSPEPEKLPRKSAPAKSPERGGGNLRKGVGAVKSDVLKQDSTPLNLMVPEPKKLGVSGSKGLSGKGNAGGVGSALDVRWFDAKRKKAFLKAAYTLWPAISKICKAVRIHPQTYYNHLHNDPEFARAISEVDRQVTDDIELVVRRNAKSKKGFLDRAMYLRARRPELYDRAKKIIVEGFKMSDGEAGRRRDTLAGAVDAEIVKTYEDRKQKRQAQLGGGGASGAGDGGKA